ncbi:peptidase inhibitor family I36 protein [Streptomyces sp. NPDC015242]|uniref:peptidase inhibitor family I36 protein n=1 Tax=Streptomyces sp. NPDC015242 TaxID=3364951 RepID=UPI0036F8E710
MTTTRIGTALTALGLTALSLTALPGAAQAAGTPASPRAVAADGNLHAWEHEKKGGRHCAWPGNVLNWESCDMRNRASSLYNNGRTHDVLLYFKPEHVGAHYCLNRGVYLENIVHHYFPHNGEGGGTSLNDNIASHKWVADC